VTRQLEIPAKVKMSGEFEARYSSGYTKQRKASEVALARPLTACGCFLLLVPTNRLKYDHLIRVHSFEYAF
jgi:hypothetical protein